MENVKKSQKLFPESLILVNCSHINICKCCRLIYPGKFVVISKTICLSLIKTLFHFFNLGFQKFTVLLKFKGKLLFISQLISQTISIINLGLFKVENILKVNLDSIPSPSPSVKIQNMGGKVCLRCKGETLQGVVNKHLKTKSVLTMPSNILPLHFKQIFPPIF